MINILPESGRTSVKREYTVRLIAVSLIACAAIAATAGALLAPSFLIAKGVRDTAALEAERLALKVPTVQGDPLEVLSKAQSQMTALSSVVKDTRASDAILAVSEVIPAGVTVVRISYGAAKREITFSGVASTRDTLLTFSRNVENIPGVYAVALPVNDLAKNEKVPFTLTVTFKELP